ncbi:MAG: DMT family transporter [Roseiarcus sp.]|jgi:drug/metabolite transporter (DMT)-like permease
MFTGIALKVAATFVFAAMSAMIKIVSPVFPVGEVVLFRSLFALAVLAAWLASRGEFPRALHTRRKLGHIGRSIAGSGGMFANFAALSLLPLADATAFTFAAPLMVVPLAALTLGETVRFYRWAAVGLGFVGVVVMLSDHLGEGFGDPAGAAGASLGAGIALAGAACTAVAMIQTRRLTRSEPTGAIVFYFSSLTAVVSAALIALAALWPADAAGAAFLAGQRWVAPSAGEFVLLGSIGVLGGGGQILMTASYRFADASIIAAFDYVAMIWAAALGYALFAEAPSPSILLGAAIVAGAGVFVLWREHSARRIRRAAAAAMGGEAPRAA